MSDARRKWLELEVRAREMAADVLHRCGHFLGDGPLAHRIRQFADEQWEHAKVAKDELRREK